MKFRIPAWFCTVTLAGLTFCATGCASRQVLVLGDRGCIPAPLSSPDAVPAAKTSPVVLPFGDVKQPTLPAGMETAPVSKTQPSFVPEGGKTTAKTKRTYTVVKGDSLSIIAYRYQITWKDLAKENGLNEKSALKVGQVLTLPDNAASIPRQRPATTTASKKKVATTAAKTTKTTANKPLPADGIYVVQANDSLWKIAHTFGLRSSDIKDANPTVDFNKLQPGEKIVLPKGGKAAASPASATKATSVGARPAPVVPEKATSTPAEATAAPADNEPKIPIIPTDEAAPATSTTPAATSAAAGTETAPLPTTLE